MTKPKKNIKEVLSNDQGDEPCVCGHPRRSHLGEYGKLCLPCYVEFNSSGATNRCSAINHEFKLDNLALIERLYDKKELERYKKYMEKFYRES